MKIKLQILKFTSATCPPCRAMKKPLASWVSKHPGVTIREADVDTQAGEAESASFLVLSLPTLLAFAPGGKKPLGRMVGFGSSTELHEWLDKMLTKASAS